MQTIPVNPKLQNKAVHHAPTTHVEPLPALPSGVTSGPGQASKTASAHPHAKPHAEYAEYAEMDAMLIRDPNTGAVHGLRFALLFNAGLALSALMAWELWTLLAS